ncbi:Beta-1,2-xylosyltransferase 1 [Tolypocladium ophioglossoides CBS 100239]|uniref:Beta-1,2-xylosyltransferase 1 n=1 Tax=Tolypocladium ophioglossoides (strain CBS 100239) TaxID=1163406 RepID=A0A0L0N2H9_TOLOC|nr:Beta-1,2-xylosyltransferase 1 [Tolypocladium ophioglossoides CBS 100239]
MAWGTILATLFAILTLSNWDLRGSALSIVPAAALLVVYIALIPKTINGAHYLPLVNIEDDIFPLSLRVVVVLVFALGIETVAFGFSTSGIAPTFSLGLAKALSWYFTIRTTRYTSWCIATAMGTFSIMSTRDPFAQSSEVQAVSHVIVSFFVLGQVIHMLPRQAKARSTLWVFFLVSLVPYLANIFALRTAQSFTSQRFGHSQEHPVEALIHSARAEFESLLQKQSKNYTAAHDEYRRRYGVEPPLGFEAWYEFAASHQSPIIDDFDTIYHAISPFWKLSGDEVVEVMRHVQNAPNSELWLCAFDGDIAKAHCSHSHRTFDRNIGFLFNKLLGDLHGILPDVKFLVNHLDEPRVLIPPESFGGDHHGKGLFNLTNMSNRPVWDTITRFCASRRSGRGAWTKHTVQTFGLPFVTDPLATMDLCRHPEYSTTHGLVMSPTSFRLVEGLVPILSTGSPSTMGDILFPSPAYIESEFQYTDAHDIAWESKQNNLYWAGSTTGGFASDDQWRYYHRQRFVKLAQNVKRRQHYYLRERGGVVARVRSSFLNSRLFDVAFTRIFQCERKFCRDQRAFFNVKAWADKDRAFRSRLVFDIDGNGISGRYYKLLASKSAPLKQTIFREWHDERLIPWLHYIPVSQSMEELPELVFYLTSTETGQRMVREIAEQGRAWFPKAFREIDLSIYTYRLLLELARLQDRKRQAS